MLSDIHPITAYNGLITAYSASIYITTSLPLRSVRELFIFFIIFRLKFA